MNDMGCDHVRDLLPELHLGALSPGQRRGVDGHLTSCSECRALLALIGALEAERPEPRPGSLEGAREAAAAAFAERHRFTGPVSVGAGVIPMTPRGGASRVWSDLRWSLPAAAVLVIALGTSVLWFGGEEAAPDLTAVDALAAAPAEDGYAFYMGEDPVVAGGVVLEDLSDEELKALLEELES
jgi:anti-sigma factor RsiW